MWLDLVFFFSPLFSPCLPLLSVPLCSTLPVSPTAALPLSPPLLLFSPLSFPLYSSSSFCPPPLARLSASLFLFPRHRRFKGLISSRLPQLDPQLCCLCVLHDWERIGYYYTRSLQKPETQIGSSVQTLDSRIVLFLLKKYWPLKWFAKQSILNWSGFCFFFICFFFQHFFNLYNLVDLTSEHIFPAGPLITKRIHMPKSLGFCFRPEYFLLFFTLEVNKKQEF